MEVQYGHLTLDERCEVACLRTAGHSLRQIAASLDRSPSTISRELRRNGSRTKGYHPGYADQQAQARRWCGSKLERDDSLRQRVLSGLQQCRSPEQVAGRLALETGRSVISHETICRFIHAQIRRTKNYNWRHFLPKAKSKRGWPGRGGGNYSSISVPPALVRTFSRVRKPPDPRPLGGKPDAAPQDGPGGDHKRKI